MAFPYQCLVARIDSAGDLPGWTLVGASGPKLVVQSSEGLTSTWPNQDGHSREQEDDAEGPPGKRIKLEEQKEQKSNFANLILSHNGQYLVGVTGEDKCIRVFQIDSQGKLEQLSERSMSRRPSSITLAADDSTILCADKFGDVYALPLIYAPEEEIPETSENEVAQSKEKEWVPSATTLTVHSGRNRRTLEDQLKQKAKGLVKSKEPMRFKHDLLLGHVSMLTDIVCAKHDSRSYIITADRDEHIRISRGIPQTHIIEGFCFGHTSFVSRLCLTSSGLLVSGGGDDDLLVWDWQNCRLVAKLPIQKLVSEFVNSYQDTDKTDFKVAISGICNGTVQGQMSEIIVSCEGIPALFSFVVGSSDHGGACIPLKGNALDVALLRVSSTLSTLAVSIDNVHVQGSTSELRRGHTSSAVQYFDKRDSGSWEENLDLHRTLSWFELQGSKLSSHAVEAESTAEGMNEKDASQASTESRSLKDILYNVENLRKRPGADDEN